MINKKLFHKSLVKTIEAIHGDGITNCYHYHNLASKALTKLGVENKLQIGYAIWRINGDSPSGIVCHIPNCGVEIAQQNANSLQYHAWIVTEKDIVDFTTFQLKIKSEALDKVDGNTNKVEWSPPYLWEDERKMSTFDEVRDGYSSGVYFYKADQGMHRVVARSFKGVTKNDVQLLIKNYNTLVKYDEL